jgi:hypothetical protein
MSLTLVATPGASTANAYATVATAIAAAAYRIGANVTAWLALTTDQQIQTLVMATRDLDTVRFKGARATTTQALEWPRTGTDYDDELPPLLVSATIEHAFTLAPAVTAATDPLEIDTSEQRVKEDTVGPITTIYFAPPAAPLDASGVAIAGLERFTALVQRLLAPLAYVAPVSSWGSSYVTRTS